MASSCWPRQKTIYCLCCEGNRIKDKEPRINRIKRIVFMERIVRILNQSGLQTRQYMDRKTGDQKVINSVVLKLTDGTDTFLGEITGERAVNCPKYDPQYIYKVQCSMVVREWNSQQTGEAMQATTSWTALR